MRLATMLHGTHLADCVRRARSALHSMKSPSVAALIALSVAFVAYERTIRPALLSHLLLFALGVLYGVALRGAKAKPADRIQDTLGKRFGG